MTMLPELRDVLDELLDLVCNRVEVAARLPLRKQRALARHLAAMRDEYTAGADHPSIPVQHRLLTVIALFHEADGLARRPPPASSRKRLRRGSHLQPVE